MSAVVEHGQPSPPFAVSQNAASLAVRAAQNLPAAQAVQEPLSLLVVDDNEFLRATVSVTLETILPGSRVDAAGDGPSALRRAAERGYDLILLDIHMPGEGGGLVTLQELRQRGYRGPIIVASAESNAEVAAQAFRLGASDYVVKSDHYFQALLNTVTRQLETERLRREKEEAQAGRERLIESLQTANAALADKIAALQQAQAQLVQSEKMAVVGALAAGVAHEINNPLGFVKGNLNAIRNITRDIVGLLERFRAATPLFQRTPDPALRQFWGEIETEAQARQLPFVLENLERVLDATRDGVDRAARIVGDLVTFSGVDRAEPQTADLAAELDRALNLVSGEIKRKAEIVRDYEPLPLVRCRPRRLGQVFVNLLVNAAHAIPERGTITVRTRLAGSYVRLEVQDTGKGIPPEILPRIFDPFFTTKEVGQGTGLGLAVSHSIVKAHGGRIEVQSTVGLGTTFTVILPINGSNS